VRPSGRTLSSTLRKAEGSKRSRPARRGGDGGLIWQSANGEPFAKTTAPTGKLGHSFRSSTRIVAPIVVERTASRDSATRLCAGATCQKPVAFPIDAKLMHAHASGARTPPGEARRDDRRELTPIPPAGRQTRADRPSALRPRQAVQAGQSVAEDDPNLSRPGHARHRAQDQGDAERECPALSE
jgi:hypothetical protein